MSEYFQPLYDVLFDLYDSISIQKDISFGDLLAAVSIFLAVYQFRKQMIASRKDHEREQKESWFLNVIVLPLLPGFKEFYDGLVDNVKEQRGRINNTPPGHDNENRLELIGKIEDENGSSIMDFYNHVSVLVGSYDESLGAKLMTMMDDLVDICSDLVRRYEDVDNQDAISVHILRHEREVISFLNRGMRVIK